MPLKHRYRFENNFYDDLGIVNGAGIGTEVFSTSSPPEGVRLLSTDVSGNAGMETGSITLPASFSVGCWVRCWHGSPASGTVAIFDSIESSDGIRIYYDHDNTRIVVETQNGTSTAYAYSDTYAYTSGAWVHIMITVDRAAGTCKIYEDGIETTSSDNDVLTDFRLTADWRIGLNHDYTGDSWAYFDDWQFYDEELDSSELTYIFDNPGFAAVANRDLIARYKFNNNFEDSVNNFILKHTTGITFDTSSPTPKEGTHCMEGSVSGNQLEGPKLNLSNETHSFAFWLMPGDMSSESAYQYLFHNYGYENDEYDGGSMIYIRESQNSLYYRLYYDSSNYYYIRSQDNCLTLDEWNHCVVTYNRSTSTLKIYVNGEDVGQYSNCGSNYVKANSPFILASRYNPIGSPLEGWMDDFQIYNRELTEGLANLLYNNPGKSLYDITGHVQGQATVSGTLTAASQIGDLEGDITGAAVVSGTLTAKGAIVPNAINGAAVVSGVLSGKASLTPMTITGQAVVNGAISGKGSLVPLSVTGSTTVAGTLSGKGQLAGSISGAATANAGLIAKGSLSASMVGTATVNGTLRAKGTLSGSVAGDSSLSGALTGIGKIAGSVSGSATVTGDLTNGNNIGVLEGAIAGSSTVSGILTGKASLAGSITGQANVAGTILGKARLTGSITGASTVSATIRGKGLLQGAAVGSSTVAGLLQTAAGTTIPIAGDIIGSSAVTGILTGKIAATGSISGQSTAAGTLRGIANLTGSTTGTSSATAAMKGKGMLQGDIAASAIASGNLTGGGSLSGVISGLAVVTGKIYDYNSLVYELILGESIMTDRLDLESAMTENLDLESIMTTGLDLDSIMQDSLDLESIMTDLLTLNSFMEDG